MNKRLRDTNLLFWMLLFSQVVVGQGFEELNQYKYFQVIPRNPHDPQASHLQRGIESQLSHKNMPIYQTRADLDRLNAKECEILRVYFQSFTGAAITLIPYIEIEIQFFNCNNRLLYSFRERKASSLLFMGKSYDKVIAKALRPLRRFSYQYNPAGGPVSHQNQVLQAKTPLEALSDVDKDIPQCRQKNEKAIAVVIGNQTYQDKDIPSVDYALNDARTVKKYLMDTFGFLEGNISYIENATQANFNAFFGTRQNPKGLLYNYVSPGESDVFVYYSGHGMPFVEQKTGFFVPVDCHPSVISLNGYALNTFYENLSKIPYRSLTVLIDACFSGGSENGFLIKQASPIYIKSKNKVINKANTLLLLSSTGEQISSWYPEKHHSLFTYYFLKGIQGNANANGDRRLSLEELREYIDKEVIYKARRLHNRNQTPEIVGPEKMTVLEY